MIYEKEKPIHEDMPEHSWYARILSVSLIVPKEEGPPIAMEEVQKALTSMENFFAPRPDEIKNYSWKKFFSTPLF